MKLLRTSASLLAFSAFALLAACGGGGGGGSVTPPGGGGGGGTPPPSGSPAPSPTPTSAPTGSGITVSSTEYVAYDSTPAHSWGTDNWQTNGATAGSDTGDGDTSAGGTGSNTVDNVSCSLPNGEATGSYYHQHAFVGIYVNGSAYALPDAIGMLNPDSSEPIFKFQCAYNIHTHADSGVVHVEDPSIPSNAAAPAKYNLQTLFDIWGQPMGTLPISGVAGLPAIYVGTPSGKDSKGNPLVTSYSSVADPTSVLLKEDTAIWLIYGTPPSGGVPQVGFGIE